MINSFWKINFLEIFMWAKNKIYLDLNLFLFINKEILFNWNVGVRKCTFLENNAGDILLYNVSRHKPRDFLKTITHNKCLKGDSDIMTPLSQFRKEESSPEFLIFSPFLSFAAFGEVERNFEAIKRDTQMNRKAQIE